MMKALTSVNKVMFAKYTQFIHTFLAIYIMGHQCLNQPFHFNCVKNRFKGFYDNYWSFCKYCMIIGGLPMDLKTKIRYLISCCSLNYFGFYFDPNKEILC